MKSPPIESLVSLLHYCESFAKQMLAASGEFYPFGAFINLEGKVEALAAHMGQEHPNSQEVYAALHGMLVQMANEEKIIGFAVAANVNVPAQYASALPDAIRVHVEAPDYSRQIYTPYRLLPYQSIRKFLGFLSLVEYHEPIPVDLEPNVFPSSAG